ncbi:hypothetical protein PVAND_006361 [Polypedilum vanderplanki]|uniref:Uncharacterized protein n=1 Tax=Polypedilum vanderplanki TaxID=319348 RepID=A0A9J6C3E3_POLVA|nr:hypothetical protein PVAND_006361 [Polypedilum vanderplanki]
MKDLCLKFLIFCLFINSSLCHHKYPCGNKFYIYQYDDEPAEYGVYAGKYAPNKPAYVALIDDNTVLNFGRLQLDPPGMLINDYSNSAKETFINDSNRDIYYLYKNRHHKYEWVDSKNGELVPYAIDFGTYVYGIPNYFGRIKIDGFYRVGLVSIPLGNMYYPGKNGVAVRASTGYQVLTCKSCRKNEPPTKFPPMKLKGAQPDVGCIHSWVEYKGESSINGVSAGFYDCNNTAYVGKVMIASVHWILGRIQTVGNSGIYTSISGRLAYIQNGSSFLVDNPNYSYYWVDYKGKSPNNAVRVRTATSIFSMPIGRTKINGKMNLGMVIDPSANFLNDNGIDETHTNFEILVCDPWPKFQCGQEWKKYKLDSAPTTDGFAIGTYKDNIISYIGRGTSKCINNCDYEIGRIQINPQSSAGVYYIDYFLKTEKFDNLTAEYLVKNPNYTYNWIPSSNGMQVKNALEIQKEGNFPFYIGITKINDNIFIGKVKPGEGLFYTDLNGNLSITSSYQVLTCTQSDSSFGISEDKKDESWLNSFGCSERKEWSFTEWKCVCKEEFKNIFIDESAKWDENFCSYLL